MTKALEDFKAHEIVNIELAGKSAIADYMLVASGTSSRQVTAMAENLITRLKQNGIESINVEGIKFGDWVLIDSGDIIIHLFRPEVRAFYGLEKMWGVEFETN
ncbi:ribosome silencing factor [Rhodospirillaceae bacterium]|nr:ribosome silencing factor [Rhodospirillaceae bacterium]